MKTCTLILFCLLPLAANANTLYKCTDGSGSILYTNQKAAGKACIVLSHLPSESAPGITSSGTPYVPNSRPRASATPTPGDFPRVSGNEQRSRDSDRRAILGKELLNEEQNLDAARKQLQEMANQPADKLQPTREAITVHERNVIALKKELANLR